jgi:hypothetical protein
MAATAIPSAMIKSLCDSLFIFLNRCESYQPNAKFEIDQTGVKFKADLLNFIKIVRLCTVLCSFLYAEYLTLLLWLQRFNKNN